jgi:CheY-specific phosphatase CheX
MPYKAFSESQNKELFARTAVNAVEKTFRSLTGITPTPADQSDGKITDLAGLMTCTSPYFRGERVLTFPQQTIRHLLAKVYKDKFDQSDSTVRDATGELTSLIYGTVRNRLNEAGCELQVSLPVILNGEIKSSLSQHEGEPLVLCFNIHHQYSFTAALKLQSTSARQKKTS